MGHGIIRNSIILAALLGGVLNTLTADGSETYSDFVWEEVRGVNVKDPMITGNERIPSGTLPSSSWLQRSEQNLIRIKELGFNTVRAYYHWEAYVHHPTEFIDRAEFLAKRANELNLKIVWDNHQWYVSSYLRSDGTGFPSYVLQNYQANGSDPEIQRFWDDLVNNRIYVNGVSVWDLQADFMIKLVNRVDRYDSTLGYEILNEPRVYTHTNFEKLGVYHTYMAQKLREQTMKPILFDRAIVKFSKATDPQLWGKSGFPSTIPQGVDNIIFTPHEYDVPYTGTSSEKLMNNIETMADKLGIPVVYGEWAAGSKEDMAVFLNKFKEFNHGWIYHSYAQGAMYNLLDSNNQETVYLTYLLEAMSEVAMKPIDAVSLSNFGIYDVEGRVIETETNTYVGQQIVLRTTILNNLLQDRSLVYFAQVRDSDGVTVMLSWIEERLLAQRSLDFAIPWTPSEAGTYDVEVFAWSDTTNPAPLTLYPLRTSLTL